jgi:opacity protein-like surface antigen
MAGVVLTSGLSWGLGSDNLITLNNSLRLSWNDNYYQAPTNKTATAAITESPDIMVNINRETTFIGLHYRPSFIWYSNPSIERRHTVQHELDANLNQTISSRMTLSVSEALRRGIQPEMLDRNNALTFPDQSYIENTLNGNMGIQLRESTRLDLSGSYYILHYDTEAIATNSNYNILSAGLALRQEISKATTVSGLLNYNSTSYRQAQVRSANMVSLGGGVDHSFGPRLLGSISGGYQLKSFELASIDGQNSPYGNFSLTYLFNPRMRFTAGGSYSLWEADITNYASQERLSTFASLGYDITARLSLYASGGITRGKYSANQAAIPGAVVIEGANQTSLTGETVMDGVDTIYQFSARLSYQLNRHNWIDLGYAHTTASSELRPDFDQNLYDVGWRISF